MFLMKMVFLNFYLIKYSIAFGLQLDIAVIHNSDIMEKIQVHVSYQGN